MDRKPIVSIGLPVYNGERYLEQALDSLLAQEFEDFELIISDNASTDATEQICQEYAAREGRIRYYRNNTNLGAVANFNRVFELSSGEYFMWAAHDDLWHPSYIGKCIDILIDSPYAVVCCSAVRRIDENGAEFGSQYPVMVMASSPSRVARVRQLLSYKNPAFPIYGIIRSKALKNALPLGSGWGPDVVLLTELCLQGDIVALPEILFSYREFRSKSIASMATTLDPNRKVRGALALWMEQEVEMIRKICSYNMGLLEKSRVVAAAVIALGKHWPVWLKMSLNERAYFNYVLPALESRDHGKRTRAAYYAILSIINSPFYLFSAGVWLILVEAIIGPHLTLAARRSYRRIFPGKIKPNLAG